MKQKLNVLISVSDKTNLDKIAHYLSDENCNLISTGGTFQYLEKLNLKNLKKVSEITKNPEILDGRVKTLHPIIHGGILAKRNNQKHLNEINDLSGIFIDLSLIHI